MEDIFDRYNLRRKQSDSARKQCTVAARVPVLVVQAVDERSKELGTYKGSVMRDFLVRVACEVDPECIKYYKGGGINPAMRPKR